MLELLQRANVWERVRLFVDGDVLPDALRAQKLDAVCAHVPDKLLRMGGAMVANDVLLGKVVGGLIAL